MLPNRPLFNGRAFLVANYLSNPLYLLPCLIETPMLFLL
jgi:hypothetical protein